MPPYESINLHPNSHDPTTLASHTYDVIFIGSGWASHTAAKRLAKANLTSVIIESELFGGDCPFWACVPSKVLLRPGDALEEVKNAPGVSATTVDGLSAGDILKTRDDNTYNWDDSGIINFISGEKVAVVRGRGRLVDVKKVLVEGIRGQNATLEARNAVVVCTGSEPVFPSIPGLAEAKPWTPRHATSTSEVPKHLVILGAGAVGCEIATAFTDFGGKVSLITTTAEILPRVDSEAGAVVRKSLSDMGVQVHLSSRVTKVDRSFDGELTVFLGGGKVIHATEILVAAGRKPMTEDLGLEQFGLVVDGKPIPVDDSLRIPIESGDWLYAGGDVNGRAMMTHSTKYHGRVLARAILAKANANNFTSAEWDDSSATADNYARPQVIFTRPPVASVGLTRQTAEQSGKKVKEITAPVATEASVLRSKKAPRDGWAQWIVDEDSGTLLGATFAGDGVTELLHASTVAIVGRMNLAQLAHAIPSFPTLSEVYLNLIEAAGF
ncbi:MAG: hypothetical protein M1820_000895 [Bogoriella megaspora]|nr:MAG: hypothetical protein M1820_000895 [Bogoriella megaspora]